MRLIINILALIIMTTLSCFSQNNSLLTKIEGLRYCLDNNEFKIGDLQIGQSKEKAIQTIGTADSIRKLDNESIESDYYKGLRIDYDKKETIIGIVVSSNKLNTPSGIHTGLSRIELFVLLGINTDEIPSIKYGNSFRNCDNNLEFYIEYDESTEMKIIELGITNLRE